MSTKPHNIAEDQSEISSARRILIVDDNRGDRLLCERHIRKISSEDFECSTAACGADALELVRTNSFSAVLLDYYLPDSVELELVPKLREQSGDPELPVLLLTGLGDEELAADALTGGLDDYLTKNGLSSQVLSRALGNAFEKANLKREARKRRQQLEISNRELLDRNREIRKFYQTVSHELKTPVTAIREFSSLVIDGIAGDVNEEQKDFLNISVQCCDRLARMIDDLCDTARAEQGKLSLHTKYSDLGLVVETLSPTLALLAEKEGIEYVCDLQRPLPCTLLDSDRINQLISNLVTNAIRYTEADGRITVGVSFAPAESELVLTVSDTGCGIPIEDQPAVFGRFVQAKDKVPTGHKGMGIGLYLCQAIAEMHGGSISLESTEGKGTTFTTLLPVLDKR